MFSPSLSTNQRRLCLADHPKPTDEGKPGPKPSILHHVFPAGSGPMFWRSWAGLGRHFVRPLIISAPLSSRRRCWHSMPASGEPSEPWLETAVSDCSTESLPHSLLYSKVMPASSWLSRIEIGALCIIK